MLAYLNAKTYKFKSLLKIVLRYVLGVDKFHISYDTNGKGRMCL